MTLKNRLLIMHILPGDLPDYITFEHGLSKIVVVQILHKDSKTVKKERKKGYASHGFVCNLYIYTNSMFAAPVCFYVLTILLANTCIVLYTLPLSHIPPSLTHPSHMHNACVCSCARTHTHTHTHYHPKDVAQINNIFITVSNKKCSHGLKHGVEIIHRHTHIHNNWL